MANKYDAPPSYPSQAHVDAPQGGASASYYNASQYPPHGQGAYPPPQGPGGYYPPQGQGGYPPQGGFYGGAPPPQQQGGMYYGQQSGYAQGGQQGRGKAAVGGGLCAGLLAGLCCLDACCCLEMLF